MPSKPLTAEGYLKNDYRHTLFPLTTTLDLVERSSAQLKDFIYKRIFAQPKAELNFLPQQRCYAAKRGFHLRRTVKLDPVAEFYIYDVVFRNRRSFRDDDQPTRKSFGYRFKDGRPQSPAAAYGVFKKAIRKARRTYKFTLSLDVATYFNSIYHHDLVSTVEDLGWPKEDSVAVGRFLREINSGRSIDCLPHGLHPCKALGSEFLRFIENSARLRSDLTLRFLDDIHLFADSRAKLNADLLMIQQLLGDRGLSLNTAKTVDGPAAGKDIEREVDKVKASLLQLRRFMVVVSDDVEEVEEIEERPLSQKQIEYLITLITTPDVEEPDAELVLSLLREHSDVVFPRIIDLLSRFPGLTKTLYTYVRFAKSRDGLDDLLEQFLGASPLATEYQLFWLAKLAEDFLPDSPKLGVLLNALYQHTNGTVISRAKILEIPDKRFGLPDLREEKLRAGGSNWEAWAAASGARATGKARRNHLLGYFANASAINRLLADSIKQA